MTPAPLHRTDSHAVVTKANGLAGSPAEVVEKIGHYAETGSRRIYLQFLDPTDLDHLELIAAEVQSRLS